jgi:osmotically-inducible protein OsmY
MTTIAATAVAAVLLTAVAGGARADEPKQTSQQPKQTQQTGQQHSGREPAGQQGQQPGAQQQTGQQPDSARGQQDTAGDQQQRARMAPDQQQRQGMARDESGRMRARGTTLEDRIFVRLAERAWAGADFKIDASDGQVAISGTVPNEEAKQRILSLVRRTPGVTDVKDQMTIASASARQPAASAGARQPSAANVPDDQLEQRVAERIAGALQDAKAGKDWWFGGWRVEGRDNEWNLVVHSDEGRVSLDGDVPRLDIVRDAVQAALNTEGVQSVRSDLNVDRRYAGRPYRDAHPYGPYAYDRYRGRGAYGPGAYDRYGAYDRDDPYHRDEPYDRRMGAGGREEGRQAAYGEPGREKAAFQQHLQGMHSMSGQVTQIDQKSGKLSLKTSDGATLDLHFPPSALEDVKQGDRLSVQLGFRELGGSETGR